MRNIIGITLFFGLILIGCTAPYRGLETDRQNKPIELNVYAPADSIYVAAAKVLTSYNFPIIQTDPKLGLITTDFMKYDEGNYGFMRELITGEKDLEVQIGIIIIPKGDSSLLRATGRVKYQKKQWFGNHSSHIEPADRNRHNNTMSQIETIVKKIGLMAELAAYPSSITTLDPFNSINRPSFEQRFEFEPMQQSEFLGKDCKSVTEFYKRGCDIIQDTSCMILSRFLGTDCATIYVCHKGQISRVVLKTKDLKSQRQAMRSTQNRFQQNLIETFGQQQPFDTVYAGVRLSGMRWFNSGFRYLLYQNSGRIIVSIAIQESDVILKTEP